MEERQAYSEKLSTPQTEGKASERLRLTLTNPELKLAPSLVSPYLPYGKRVSLDSEADTSFSSSSDVSFSSRNSTTASENESSGKF